MIARLRISNYALIREISLDFHPHFNIITGETGAGKSIILGALGLLQGKRSDSRSPGDKTRKSVVEATFNLDETSAAALSRIFENENLPLDSTECVIRREIAPSGRSRATVNGTPATLQALRDISAVLIDIHSQHKNLMLSDATFQLEVIDSLGDNRSLLDEYHAVYAQYRSALRTFADARDTIDATRNDADFMQYQLDKLDELNVLPGEDADLEKQREEIARALSDGRAIVEASTSLSAGDNSAVESVDKAIDALSRTDNTALSERLESVRIELADIADAIERQASGLRRDPASLDEIDDRLSEINAAMKRFKVDSTEGLIRIREGLTAKLAQLADADNVLSEYKAAAVKLKRRAVEIAAQLTARRTATAAELSEQLVRTAAPLGMSNLRAQIVITPGKLNADGADTVEWKLAFNKNQELSAAGTTASGGEISRVMLALKAIMAEKLHLPTIIFDEIDTGVSGEVAARMGMLMADASRRMQVIAITHLPQVAARGDAHMKVYKSDDETSTATHIAVLDRDGRRAELALMLSGDAADAAALATADSLLNK